MNYILFPETIPKEKMNDDNFQILQTKYRRLIEELLKKYVNFEELDKKIEKVINIPILEDHEYNFYHKYTSLNSNYIYLRNNIHIENLTQEEQQLLESNNTGENFIKQTIGRVLFEEGDLSYFGVPISKYLASSKSLVFEFAFDQAKVKQFNDLIIIEQIIKEISDYLINTLNQATNIPISVITYNGIPDIYYNNSIREQIII